MSKNALYQHLGLTPYMGDTAPKNKGGKAATKTLTQLCKEAREDREKAGRYCDLALSRITEHNKEIDLAEERMKATEESVYSAFKTGAWFMSALFCFNFLFSLIWGIIALVY